MRLKSLAKLHLTEDEKEKSRQDLQQMLDYVDMLNQLDTSDVEPLTHIFPIKNVFREDVVLESTPEGRIVKECAEGKGRTVPCSKNHRLGGDGYENTGTFRHRAGKEDKSRRDHLRGSRKGVPGADREGRSEDPRAYLTVDEEKVLTRAKEVDNGIRSGKYTGPLAGVPIAVKDNICTKDT